MVLGYDDNVVIKLVEMLPVPDHVHVVETPNRSRTSCIQCCCWSVRRVNTVYSRSRVVLIINMAHVAMRTASRTVSLKVDRLGL